MPTNQWDAALYENKHAFVWQYGEALLELLSPRPGERILDLGCGTGQLTAQIAEAGAEVIGIDVSLAMIEKAKQNYSALSFAVADARNFQFEQPFDAVFSNAALHWVKEADLVIHCIAQALKPKGRLVAEFGGKGNVNAIVSALMSALKEIDPALSPLVNPWYFPSMGEYATELEKQGFDVTLCVLFDRPTLLEDGEAGLANWLQMFASSLLAQVSTEQLPQVIQSVEERLKPILYKDGNWTADYRRIRVVAIKN